VKACQFFVFIFFVQFFTATAFANTAASGFETSRDLIEDSPSNINLHNNGGTAATVYGLYVRQFSYVTPGQTCDHATVMYSADQNTTAGAFVAPVTIDAGKSAAIGANYLYNMIYGAAYFIHIFHPSNPPGCSLPGCTWGADTTVYNWCIYMGALAPVTTSGEYTSTVPPATDVASTGAYNYNLINNYIYLGPISCNDQTLACTVANSQKQSFP
jgi:hypothetical protein